MALGLIFWILMLLALVLGFLVAWPQPAAGPPGRWSIGLTAVWWLLLLLLGWAAFGAPIKT